MKLAHWPFINFQMDSYLDCLLVISLDFMKLSWSSNQFGQREEKNISKTPNKLSIDRNEIIIQDFSGLVVEEMIVISFGSLNDMLHYIMNNLENSLVFLLFFFSIRHFYVSFERHKTIRFGVTYWPSRQSRNRCIRSKILGYSLDRGRVEISANMTLTGSRWTTNNDITRCDRKFN